MSKLFGYGESLEAKMTGIMQECDSFMNMAMEVTGSSAMDVLGDLDAESGAFLGGVMRMYKNAKELAIMQGKAMDKMLDDLEKLQSMNERLFKENEETRRMLRELSRQLDKQTKED